MKKINSKMKLSNISSFVILIFAILEYRSFYISSFQILTVTQRGAKIMQRVGVQILNDQM